MIIRRLVPGNPRFWVIAGSNGGGASGGGSTGNAGTARSSTLASIQQATREPAGRRPGRRFIVNADRPESPIIKARRELRTFLEDTLGSADAEQALTAERMKEMLKNVVDAGDRKLFVAMLEALPDSVLREIDPSSTLLAYCLVKLSEAQGAPVEPLVAALSRFPHYDAFACELVMGRIIEESAVGAIEQFVALVQERKWPYALDDRGLVEQLITEVYTPNRRFGQVKELFASAAHWTEDCYYLVLLAAVSADTARPTEMNWRGLGDFLAGCVPSASLSSALQRLFHHHSPPDHFLQRLAASQGH